METQENQDNLNYQEQQNPLTRRDSLKITALTSLALAYKSTEAESVFDIENIIYETKFINISLDNEKCDINGLCNYTECASSPFLTEKWRNGGKWKEYIKLEEIKHNLSAQIL